MEQTISICAKSTTISASANENAHMPMESSGETADSAALVHALQESKQTISSAELPLDVESEHHLFIHVVHTHTDSEFYPSL